MSRVSIGSVSYHRDPVCSGILSPVLSMGLVAGNYNNGDRDVV